MNIIRFKINENEYTLVGEYWEKSRGWGHEATLLLNDVEINSARITYINRTWEKYTFRSVMQKVVNNLLENMKEDFINGYKEMMDIKRLTKQKRKEIVDTWEGFQEVKELMELYKKL